MKIKKPTKKTILQFVLVLFGVTMMGFGLSLLNLTHLGLEAFTCLNLTISKLLGMSVGNWQLLLNIVLFIIVFIFGRDQIGFGTLANMVLVGYSLEFFSYVWKFFPGLGVFAESTYGRFVVMVPSLLIFVVAASIYMTCGMGTSPYDATSFIIAKLFPKVSFTYIRWAYDLSVIALSFLLGGEIGIITIAMAFLLGPTITVVQRFLERYVLKN